MLLRPRRAFLLVTVLMVGVILLTASGGREQPASRVVTQPLPPPAPVVVIDETVPHWEPPTPTPPPVKKRQVGIATKGAAPAPKPGVPPLTDADFWWRLASCESASNGYNPAGPGYYGYFQFSQSTWDGVAKRVPAMAHLLGVDPRTQTYEVQREMAWHNAHISNPYGQWPNCWGKSL